MPSEPHRTRRPHRGPAIALLAGLLLLGCTEKPAVNEGRSGASEPSRREVVRIVFDLPGDDIGSQEDQVKLEALRDAIVGSRAGELVSSGFGMGTMELVVALDRADSMQVLKGIVADIAPGAKYRIVADAPASVPLK
jgi:hypothetical protein